MTEYAAVGAMWTGLLAGSIVAMALPRPALMVAWATRGEDPDYVTGDDFKDVPMDDPMRSPDWCHAHGQSYPCDGEEK